MLILTNICTLRKIPVYRAATPEETPRRQYPTVDTMAAAATNGPRNLARSLAKAQTRIAIKQTTYGGAERPLLVWWLNVPISEMMVGMKSGSDPKHTLQEKYISPGT
jgi:hypothetical protein